MLLTSQTRAQQCFTVSELVTDWHELMTWQCNMWPCIARASKQFSCRYTTSLQQGSKMAR